MQDLTIWQAFVLGALQGLQATIAGSGALDTERSLVIPKHSVNGLLHPARKPLLASKLGPKEAVRLSPLSAPPAPRGILPDDVRGYSTAGGRRAGLGRPHGPGVPRRSGELRDERDVRVGRA